MGCCNEKIEAGKTEVMLSTDVPPPTMRTQPVEEDFCDISLESPPKYSFTQQSDFDHPDSSIYIDPLKGSDYFISKVTKRMSVRDVSSLFDRSTLSLTKESFSTILPRGHLRPHGHHLSVDSAAFPPHSGTHQHKASLTAENLPHRGDQMIGSPNERSCRQKSISSISNVEWDSGGEMDWTFGEEFPEYPIPM